MERLLPPVDVHLAAHNRTHISEVADRSHTQYQQLVADIWVGVLLSLILLSCVCCTCTCLIYHKFQKWKRLVLRDSDPDMLTDAVISSYDCDSLPSYTVASGLPSYEEAIKQLESAKKLKQYGPPLHSSASRVSLMSCIHTIVDEKS